MPPAALISFTASLMPLSKLVPEVVPVPVNSTKPTTFTVCWAMAKLAVMHASKVAVFKIRTMVVSCLMSDGEPGKFNRFARGQMPGLEARIRKTPRGWHAIR